MGSLSYLAGILGGYHLRFSPKVTVPGFVGLTAISVACELDHFGYKVPFATVCLAVVQVMIFLGWLVPDPERKAAEQLEEAK